jgi:hypothetical protein
VWLLDDILSPCGIFFQKAGKGLEIILLTPSDPTPTDIESGNEDLIMNISRLKKEQLTLFIEHEDLGGGEGKVCSKCNTFLPLSSYSFTSGGNYLRPECRKCNQELSKTREELRYKHGPPPENYICPICLADEESVKGKGNTRNGSWVLDHNHQTKSFRGWLCHKCNRALGGFDDNIEILNRAINYLECTDGSETNRRDGNRSKCGERRAG